MITVFDPAHGGNAARGKSTPLGKTLAFGLAGYDGLAGLSGHDSHDSHDSHDEKTLTLAMAQRLASSLGNEARLTRDGDENRSLAERIAVARAAQAGVFISLHAHPAGSGSSAAWVHTAANEPSQALAAAIQQELDGMPAAVIEVRRGDLAVLAPDRHLPDTAACLVELEVATQGDADRLGQAVTRALQRHAGRYGQRRVVLSQGRTGHGRTSEGRTGYGATALGNEDIVFASTDEILAYIADRLTRQQNWSRGVDDTTQFPFSAICHLQMTASDGQVYTGTGFYIGRDRILTCGHNIHFDGVGTASVIVTPGKNGTAATGSPFTVAGAQCEIHPQWRNSAMPDGYDRAFDLAVIRVTTPPPGDRWFSYLDDRQMSVAPVAVCGYSADTVNPDRQHLDIDMIRGVSANGERADYEATIEHGSSGGPVFYVHGVEDPATQTSHYDIGIVGVNTRLGDADMSGRVTTLNSCCLLTPAKTAWIRSLGGTYSGRGRAGARSQPPRRTFGRPAATALGNEELVFADTDAVMTYITNRAGHFGQWLVGIDNTHLFPFSAICHLKIIRDDDSGGSYHQGTGFYIGNDRILTCGHNIEEDGHRALRIEITPGKNGASTAGPTFTVQASSCFLHPQYRDANVAGGYNEDFDMAVIRVASPPPYGIIFDELDDSLTSQSAIAVCGYGYVASQFDDRLHLDIDTIRTVNDTLNQASYDAFTAGGNSGSPVFFVRSVDDPVAQVCRQSAVVVGVHILGYPATAGRPETSLNSCCLITPEKRRWILQDWSAYGSRQTARNSQAARNNQAARNSQAVRSSPPGRAMAGRRPVAATNVYAGGRTAAVIAHGAHERYGKRSLPARAASANESFDDVDLLDANLVDRRRGDTRTVSTLADADVLIATFSSGSAAGAWAGLSRAVVAAGLTTVIRNPGSVNQGGLNLCGPTAFIVMWAGRDPVAFVRFVTSLYEQGSARLGNRTITPGATTRSADYNGLSARLNGNCPDAASWLALAALRDDENAILPYDGSSSEALSGSTTPEELAGWMEATGIWTVRNEADWTHILPSRGIPHAQGLYSGNSADIALLIHANLMFDASQANAGMAAYDPANPFRPGCWVVTPDPSNGAAAPGDAGFREVFTDYRRNHDSSFLLNQFPDHFVILRNEPLFNDQQQTLAMRIWTWADVYQLVIPRDVFLANYYGSVIASL